jgi:hypothetical protein
MPCGCYNTHDALPSATANTVYPQCLAAVLLRASQPASVLLTANIARNHALRKCKRRGCGSKGKWKDTVTIVRMIDDARACVRYDGQLTVDTFQPFDGWVRAPVYYAIGYYDFGLSVTKASCALCSDLHYWN